MTTERSTTGDNHKPLTPQQQRFVEEYCCMWKGAPAARAAGYAASRARQTANELLQLPHIQAAVQKRSEELGMKTAEATVRMSNWGRASIEDVMTKEVVEYTPRVQKPLAQVIDEFRAEIDFEQEVAIATEALLTGKAQAKFLKQHQAEHQRRKIRLLRMTMELARNPSAKRWVNGETIAKEVVNLDLVKVVDAKLGGLIKKITPNQFGTSVELHDAKDAVDKMLKLQGAYGPVKVDHTTNGKDLPHIYTNIYLPDNGRDEDVTQAIQGSQL